MKIDIRARLSCDYLLDAIEHGLLRDIVEECFLAGEEAEDILTELFNALVVNFDFKKIIKGLDNKERFLTDLLYQIYYLNLSIEYLRSQELLLFYLIRTAALSNNLQLFDALTPDQKERCIAFCQTHFDEGSYNILKQLPRQVEYEGLDLPYSREEIDRFVSIFGLYGHQVPKEAWEELKDEHFLGNKLKSNEFKEAVCSHIEALSKHRDEYVMGMELITWALPTAGKELSSLAWIPSLTKSLEAFSQEFGIKNSVPIYVFDQSEPALFAKNGDFLRGVNPNCRHIATEDALFLAKALKIEKLVQTDPSGRFGYGGARNAIYLLMPLIRFYDQQNIDFHTVSEAELRQDFNDVVLEEKIAPCIIHMGDDDVHVPLSTAFSDALFAWRHKDEYFCRFGWVVGRKTTWTETSFNLEYLLDHTQNIVLQHKFQEVPFRHGMSGLLSKPKLCLNLPFGQEEAYLLAMKEYLFDLREPMIHLSGYRFPAAVLPKNRFSGLAAYLKAHYSYSIGSMLVSDLLDPLNLYKRCALPWNMVKEPFGSLKEAIAYICRPEVTKEMQQQFAKNRKNLAQGLKNYEDNKLKESDLALFHLSVLEEQDVDSLLQKYSRFPKEVEELRRLFKALAEDANAFKARLEGQSSCSGSLTSSLDLMIDVIEKASFQKILQELSRGLPT